MRRKHKSIKKCYTQHIWLVDTLRYTRTLARYAGGRKKHLLAIMPYSKFKKKMRKSPLTFTLFTCQ